MILHVSSSLRKRKGKHDNATIIFFISAVNHLASNTILLHSLTQNSRSDCATLPSRLPSSPRKMNGATSSDPLLHQEASSTSTRVSKVSFGCIEIHEFGTELGGSVPTNGCPVALSWNRVAYHVCSVDHHENEKARLRILLSSRSSDGNSKSSSSRKRNEVPVIPAHRRAKMLHACGYSVEEIIDVAIEMDDIRRQRRDTSENKRLDGFHYALEVSGRTLRKIVSLKPSLKRNVQSAKMA